MTIANIIKFKQIKDKLKLDLKSKNDFESRFFIQKTFYFLCKLGIDLDIKFNFYAYGPYSQDLTDFLLTVQKFPVKELENLSNYELTNEEETILQKVKSILKNWGGDLRKLELYASVLYILKDMYIKDRNMEKVKETLKKLKPDLFEDKKFQQAIEDLLNEGLIDNVR